jgi:hypothetical protein
VPDGLDVVAVRVEHGEDAGAVRVGAMAKITAFQMDPNPQGFGKVLSPLITRDIRKTVAGDLERLERTGG